LGNLSPWRTVNHGLKGTAQVPHGCSVEQVSFTLSRLLSQILFLHSHDPTIVYGTSKRTSSRYRGGRGWRSTEDNVDWQKVIDETWIWTFLHLHTLHFNPLSPLSQSWEHAPGDKVKMWWVEGARRSFDRSSEGSCELAILVAKWSENLTIKVPSLLFRYSLFTDCLSCIFDPLRSSSYIDTVSLSTWFSHRLEKRCLRLIYVLIASLQHLGARYVPSTVLSRLSCSCWWLSRSNSYPTTGSGTEAFARKVKEAENFQAWVDLDLPVPC